MGQSCLASQIAWNRTSDDSRVSHGVNDSAFQFPFPKFNILIIYEYY